MSQRSITEGVDRFIESLSRTSDTTTPVLALVKSSLTTVVQICNMLEGVCARSSETDSIRLAIFGMVKPPPSLSFTDRRSDPDLFSIWGPDLSRTMPQIRDSLAAAHAQSPQAQLQAPDGLATSAPAPPPQYAPVAPHVYPPMQPPSSRPLEREEVEAEMADEGMEGSVHFGGDDFESWVIRQPSNLQGEQNNALISKLRGLYKDGEWHLPVEATSRCMSYFLDGNGRTRHVSCLKARDMGSINGRMLAKAMQELYRARKGSAKPGARGRENNYLGLVPSILRKKNVYFPKVSLVRGIDGKPFVVSGTERVVLDVLKADRNRKEVSFGAITLLLHCEAEPTIQVLDGVSKRGLSKAGCGIWRSCGKSETCVDRSRAIVQFSSLSGRGKVVGRGCVDPFSTFLMGRELAHDEIVVQFCEVESVPGQEGEENLLVLERPTVWKRRFVSRRRLLGERGEIWGDGILVVEEEKVIQKIVHHEVMGDLHSKNAVMVCDVRVSRDFEHECYPYAAWYGSKSDRLRRTHFCDERVPFKMGDIRARARALLWHRDRLQ